LAVDPSVVGAGLTVADLRSQNPWWSDQPQPRLPSARRWLFPKLEARILRPLAPVLLVRGPRQVGKTTLQQQLIAHLLIEGVPPSTMLRAQFDDVPSPRHSERALLDIVRWFEDNVLGVTFNEAAHRGRPAVLFLDEVQNLRNWDVQLKQLVDASDVVCVVTGSSALRIGLGRDSLAGRIQPFDLGTLRLREIAQIREFGTLAPFQEENGWQEWLGPDFWRGLVEHGTDHSSVRDAAFEAFSERGAYPRSQIDAEIPWPEVADQLNETVVRRVIQHDLRLGDRGRKRGPAASGGGLPACLSLRGRGAAPSAPRPRGSRAFAGQRRRAASGALP